MINLAGGITELLLFQAQSRKERWTDRSDMGASALLALLLSLGIQGEPPPQLALPKQRKRPVWFEDVPNTPAPGIRL